MGVAETLEKDGGVFSTTPVLDAALILDSIMNVVVTQAPEDEAERFEFWTTLISGMAGMASGALGDEKAQLLIFLTLMSLKKGAVGG